LAALKIFYKIITAVRMLLADGMENSQAAAELVFIPAVAIAAINYIVQAGAHQV
jgi:hypothetical protein